MTGDVVRVRRDFRLGVIMLRTRFPRLVGDIGNPATFPFPTVYREVEQATVATVVVDGEPAEPVAEAILEAADALAADGVSLIATSCGFLGTLQERLQQRVAVPVIASSFVLLPFLRAVYGATRPIGVLTFDAARLSPRHLGPFDDGNLVIEGIVAGGALHGAIARDLPELDRQRAEDDVADAARRLVARCPDASAVLMECSNFAPYRGRVALDARKPVYDITQMILWQAQAWGAGATT